ncbi:phage protein Gp36 family protein [Persicobacter sp. CCB-QB2]|uniref:phage protein Gp36 family protein n=1 Tax=Persicobacter sp. CCB-QB2 TaxID=1561025 RepID=UPI0006A9EFA6|nr:phage protein Gp36 family protein [Persicobacter sp. CCB-QB2]
MFLEEADLKQGVYIEILNALSREDETFVSQNISRAIAEIDGYLNQKYDTSELWAQTGDDRNGIIKGLSIDVSLYHIYSVTEEIPDKIKERYKWAKETLKDIRDGLMKLDIPLWSEKEEPDKQADFFTGGLNNRY